MNKLASTKFQQHFQGLTPIMKEGFAKRAESSVNSIRANYLRPIRRTHKRHRKFYQSTISQPNSEKMLKFARASRGALDYEDILEHFYMM